MTLLQVLDSDALKVVSIISVVALLVASLIYCFFGVKKRRKQRKEFRRRPLTKPQREPQSRSQYPTSMRRRFAPPTPPPAAPIKVQPPPTLGVTWGAKSIVGQILASCVEQTDRNKYSSFFYNGNPNFSTWEETKLCADNDKEKETDVKTCDKFTQTVCEAWRADIVFEDVDLSSYTDQYLQTKTSEKAVNTDTSITQDVGSVVQARKPKRAHKSKPVFRGVPPSRSDRRHKLWAHKCVVPDCRDLLEQRVPHYKGFDSEGSTSSDEHFHDDKRRDETRTDEYFYEVIDENGKGNFTDTKSPYGGKGNAQTERSRSKGRRRCLFSDSDLLSNRTLTTPLRDGTKVSKAEGILHEDGLEDQLSLLLSRTSFIPIKSWYSLCSLNDDDDEFCSICEKGKDHEHPLNEFDLRRLRMNHLRKVSESNNNDTGYTSTDNASDHDRRSPGYDGDYESESDEKHCARLLLVTNKGGTHHIEKCRSSRQWHSPGREVSPRSELCCCPAVLGQAWS
ncbi:uncharacterized protein LOC116621110 isoform X2 [Nematostella vectensis]|uniref:uncharacterized protein LOC116621110 isoform X2 n=1 Tax=Nematostella vectensis TaxID=45351 RepID=UPI0020772B19|nr:uncharacterized protein LOC116621110 isoform X2 [Nematostella vectensis]